MERSPITSDQLVIAQKIISFVQEQGWDIEGISIERFDENYNPLIGKDDGDTWKGKKLKWALRLSVSPRDFETVKTQTKVEL